MINRENYEISFLDYSEGTLSEKDTNSLLIFLDKNPDLKEELDLFENITLIPDNLDYEEKSELKEIPEKMFDLTQLEYLCVGKKEGDLTKDERNTLDDILDNNFNNEEDELLTISLSKLKPDKNIRFKPKSSLKRYPVISVLTQGLSFAAAILAFIFILNQAAIYNTEVEGEILLTNNYYTKIKEVKINDKLIQVQKKEISAIYKNDINKLVNNTVVEPDKKDTLTETVTTEFAELVNPRADGGVFLTNNNVIDFSELVNMNEIVLAINAPPQKKKRFWRVAEKTLNVWKRITSSETELKNKYNDKGELVEFCLNTENIKIRKKVSKH